MRFSCPNCTQLMECPDGLAGTKAGCPKCGQKVLIPTPPPKIANKTTLGNLEADAPSRPDDVAVPPVVPTAILADTVSQAIPVWDPWLSEGLVVLAAVLLLAYGSFVTACGCWDVTYGMRSLNDLANQQPGIKAAIDQHAPGLIKVSLAHGVCRFLSGFFIIAAGLVVLLKWPFGRVVAFSSILIELAIELAGRVLVVLVIIPVANRIEADRAAAMADMQMFGPPGQPEFGVGTVLMISQMVGIVVAVGIWAVFCVPVLFILTRGPVNAALGGRFSWNRFW